MAWQYLRVHSAYRHIISGRRYPLEEENAPGCHLNGDEHNEHPTVRVERLQEGRRRDDTRPLRHQNRDTGLRTISLELDLRLARKLKVTTERLQYL